MEYLEATDRIDEPYKGSFEDYVSNVAREPLFAVPDYDKAMEKEPEYEHEEVGPDPPSAAFLSRLGRERGGLPLLLSLLIIIQSPLPSPFLSSTCASSFLVLVAMFPSSPV